MLRKHAMDHKLRNPRNEDAQALRQIWDGIFGADDVDVFFNNYYNPELCITAVIADTPVASCYLLPVGNLVAGGQTLPCAMIYGVATLPEYRNLGLGSAVVNALLRKGHDMGYSAIVLCPSGDSLFAYYGSRTGFRSWFYIREQEFNNLPTVNAGAEIVPVSAEQYSRRRCGLLADIPHIQHDITALRYQELLCQFYGGGLYQITSLAGESCAVIERQQDGSVYIKELLTPHSCTAQTSVPGILSTIAIAYPADRYIVRSPARISDVSVEYSRLGTPADEPASADESAHADEPAPEDEPASDDEPAPVNEPAPGCKGPSTVIRRFGMLSASGTIICEVNGTTAPWYGPAFD